MKRDLWDRRESTRREGTTLGFDMGFLPNVPPPPLAHSLSQSDLPSFHHRYPLEQPAFINNGLLIASSSKTLIRQNSESQIARHLQMAPQSSPKLDLQPLSERNEIRTMRRAERVAPVYRTESRLFDRLGSVTDVSPLRPSLIERLGKPFPEGSRRASPPHSHLRISSTSSTSRQQSPIPSKITRPVDMSIAQKGAKCLITNVAPHTGLESVLAIIRNTIGDVKVCSLGHLHRLRQLTPAIATLLRLHG